MFYINLFLPVTYKLFGHRISKWKPEYQRQSYDSVCQTKSYLQVHVWGLWRYGLLPFALLGNETPANFSKEVI